MDEVQDYNDTNIWKKFIQQRKDYFDSGITNIKEQIRAKKQDLAYLNKRKKELERQQARVEPLCKQVLTANKELPLLGKARLNGKTAEAIEKRELCHVIGLLSGQTGISHNSKEINISYNYWCDKWFVEFLEMVDNNNVCDRQYIYSRLATCAKLQDQELINQELGLIYLEVI
jgi:hypothetical protein